MRKHMGEAGELAGLLFDLVSANRSGNAVLAGISGIDASGKGWLADRVCERIENKGITIARISADAWLNLPGARFSDCAPGATFYENGLRLAEMFYGTVIPLKRDRSVNVEFRALEETASDYESRRIRFDNVALILIEGIFLFREEFRHHFDLRVWVDCPFHVALKRAVSRSQEGLGPEKTIEAYRKIYFPAQKLHLLRDTPREFADIVFNNS